MPAQFAPQGQPTCESMPERCGLRDNACHAKEGEPDEQQRWLEGAQVRLFNPALEEVTQLLHAGPKTVCRSHHSTLKG